MIKWWLREDKKKAKRGIYIPLFVKYNKGEDNMANEIDKNDTYTDIHIEYKDESIPPFNKSFNNHVGDFNFFELRIDDNTGHSKKISLEDYVVSLKNVYRGVNNSHKTGLKSIVIKNNLFKEIGFKDGEFFYIKNNEIYGKSGATDIYNIVSFDGHDDILKEGYYFTKNGARDAHASIKYEQNVVNEEVMKNIKITREVVQGDMDYFKIIQVILGKFLPKYSFSFVTKKKEGSKDVEEMTIEYKYCNKTLLNGLEDIKEDDAFLFFKMIEVALPYIHNPKRIPVYFFDCEKISTNIVCAILVFLKLMRYNLVPIYLYNVSDEKGKEIGKMTTDIQVLNLPNHMKKSVKESKKISEV